MLNKSNITKKTYYVSAKNNNKIKMVTNNQIQEIHLKSYIIKFDQQISNSDYYLIKFNDICLGTDTNENPIEFDTVSQSNDNISQEDTICVQKISGDPTILSNVHYIDYCIKSQKIINKIKQSVNKQRLTFKITVEDENGNILNYNTAHFTLEFHYI